MSKFITLGASAGTAHAFKLPIDFATESCAIIARKGAGKSHVARVISEDLVEHVPVVIIDPLDIMWGLRLSKDGKKEGCNFVIFGGSHGDLPLVESAGKHFADLIVDRGISAIFAIDHLSLAAQRRFVADFGERLFERKSEPDHRTAVHIIVDESDSFAPQRVMPDQTRCCGVIDRLVRRGRSRGIGTTCISQRPAVLNKDVLTQTEVLICLQVTAPQDKDALNDWVKSNSDRPKASEFMESLPHLERGHAWVWSPSRLKVFEQVIVRDTRTYDSSYTPKVGERRGPTPKLTPVDFQAINAQMAAVIKEAEANDPTALKKRVRALEAELLKREKEVLAKRATPDQAQVDMIVNATERDTTSIVNTRWMSALDKCRKLLYEQAHQMITEALSGVVVDANAFPPPQKSMQKAAVGQKQVYGGELRGEFPKTFRADTSVPHPSRMSRSNHAPVSDGSKLAKAERLILTVLAQHAEGCTKAKVALIAGYSPNGGGFQNPLSHLCVQGYVTREDTGMLWISESGKKALGQYDVLPTGPELLRYWCGKLGKAHRSILTALAEAPGYTLGKQELADASGYAADGGGFQNPLSNLRVIGLVRGSGQITLSEELT